MGLEKTGWEVVGLIYLAREGTSDWFFKHCNVLLCPQVEGNFRQPKRSFASEE